MRYVFAFVVSLLLVPGVQGQQIMPAEKAAALRASFPLTDNDEWNKLFADPKTVLYTDREIVPAYQHANAGLLVVSRDGQSIGGDRFTTFHWVGYNISGDDRETVKPDGLGGNANVEFPWRSPGGLDVAQNEIGKFRFFRLPDRKGGGVYPVVYFRDRITGSKTASYHEAMRWVFPRGTIFGEVLAMKDSRGEVSTFEVRLRIREDDYWNVEVLRPFPTSSELTAELRKRGHDDLAVRVEAAPVQTVMMEDRLHRTKKGFKSADKSVTLPEFPEDVAKVLLNETKFKSAVGANFKDGAIAATSKQMFSIVPRGYLGPHIGNEPDKCMECHKHTLQHVDTFDSVRQWYGYVRGNDGIFTWHPIASRSIADTGGAIMPEIRQDFVRNGWVEKFDPAKHGEDRYLLLKGSR